MKTNLTLFLTIFLSSILYGQKRDTLTFYSEAFQQERTVYIQTPKFHKYQSDSVKLPVIYILDGQHDWFLNPLLSTIEYLQYTHEIPQALLVIIPITDRYNECGIKDLKEEALPLHRLITEEVNQHLNSYQPNDYKIIIGHSFSASFALYSHLKKPNYYSAVISNTPLDHFEKLILAIEKNKKVDKSKIYLSTGGIAKDKDYYHRKEYNRLKLMYPKFFKSIHVFEADQSAHNAVPIVANPILLSQIFENFSSRFVQIAKVDKEYKLITMPNSIEEEIKKIQQSSKIGEYDYCPEIADLNGLASRYLSSGLNDYGIAVYKMGLKFYPRFFSFHLALYELYLPIDKEKAKSYLNTTSELLKKVEFDLPEKQALISEIDAERERNGWK